MDLFAAAEGVTSGEVPREVFPGVVWDEAAEDEFGKMYLEWANQFPKTALEERWRDQKIDSCRWAVELHLFWAMIDRERKRAEACWQDVDKRHLHTEWLRTYGAKMTEAIVRSVKKPGFRSPGLGRSF